MLMTLKSCFAMQLVFKALKLTCACPGGEPYLITKERDLAWWQLALLDVYLLVATALAAALGLVLGLSYLLIRQLKHVLQGGSGQSAKAKQA